MLALDVLGREDGGLAILSLWKEANKKGRNSFAML